MFFEFLITVRVLSIWKSGFWNQNLDFGFHNKTRNPFSRRILSNNGKSKSGFPNRKHPKCSITAHQTCSLLLLFSRSQADFLQPRLLGILVFYNTVLLTNSDLEERRLALESLVKLLQIMGARHITSVRVKVMAILRLGLRFKDDGFPELSCDAWESFVRNVDRASLGPMLSQVCVTLLPHLTQLPTQVARIFEFLIVENRAALKEHFHEIYFLPDVA